jgi:hypothetical protein
MLKAILEYQMQMTVNLTVKNAGRRKKFLSDNGLQAPFIIEWE